LFQIRPLPFSPDERMCDIMIKYFNKIYLNAIDIRWRECVLMIKYEEMKERKMPSIARHFLFLTQPLRNDISPFILSFNQTFHVYIWHRSCVGSWKLSINTKCGSYFCTVWYFHYLRAAKAHLVKMREAFTW